jgi:hypothetical protein
MKTKLISAALLSSFGTLVAASGTADASERWRYEVDARQARHMELIREGRANGTLTSSEFQMLRHEQFRIGRAKRAFLADGRLDWNERQTLRYAQDAANTHIFQERNDHQKSRRWWRLAGY